MFLVQRKCNATLFVALLPPPTTLGMGKNNDFESKHPRGKGGKFTEKRREEAGMSLDDSAFSTPDWPKKHVDEHGFTTLYWEDKPFTDLAPGERYLVEEQEVLAGYTNKTFKTPKGYEIDSYKGTKLGIRMYLDRDKQPVRKFNQPYQVQRQYNDSISERYAVDRDEVEAYLSAPDTGPDARVYCDRVLRKDGSTSYERFYHKIDTPLESGEQIVGEEIDYYENGQPAEIRRFNLDGKSCGDRKYPMGQKFDENGKRTLVAFSENGKFIRREE